MKIIGGSKEKIIPLDYKFLKDTFEISLNFLPTDNENIYQTYLTEDQFNLIKNSEIKKMFLRANLLNMGETSPVHALLQCLTPGGFGSTMVVMQHNPTPEPSGVDYPVILNVTAQIENYSEKTMKLTVLQIPIIYQTSLFEKLKLNDAGYITKAVTDLTNYYNKNDVDNLIKAIHTLDIQIVTELPTENISHTTIYLKGTETSGMNDYEEWIYTVNNDWELIGSTAVDLTGYLKTEDADKKYIKKMSGSEMDAICALPFAEREKYIDMLVVCGTFGSSTYKPGHIYQGIDIEQEQFFWNDITEKYTLPTASAETLGGVKVGKTEGSGIKIDENGEIGVDPDVCITTEKMETFMTSVLTMFKWQRKQVGDGVNTSFTFTMNSNACVADFYVCDSETGEEVYPNIKKDSYNNPGSITITFAKPPKANEYTLYYYIGIIPNR